MSGPFAFSRHAVLGVCLVILSIMTILGWSQLLVHVDSGDIVVLQLPFLGTLKAETSPGTYLRWGGTITTYQRRSQFSFSSAKDQGSLRDESIYIRFNDGGSAHISGVLSWEMPLAEPAILRLHKEFRSVEAIEQQLVRPAVERAMYLTGPLMSSTESYASRRSELLQIFEDQLRNGIYRTHTHAERQTDPITGQEKTVQLVDILKGPDGVPLREGVSPIQDFGLSILPPSINLIRYDDDVEKQISQQREAVMAIQTAQAQARQAEQAAITAEKNGEANAARSKWEQEAIKAKAVVEAQQEKEVAETAANRDRAVAVTAAERERDVADLAKQSAEFTKQKDILLGEGESQRRQLVLAADGALAQKLDAYVAVNEAYATAIGAYRGNWVPGVVMAGGGAPTAGIANSQDLIGLLTAKTARDLNLDLGIARQSPSP